MPTKDWTYYYNKYGATNSVCGLGKEQASIRSYSFNSLANSRGDIEQNTYSFEIYPHLQYFSSSNTFRNMKMAAEGLVPEKTHAADTNHHLGKLPYEFSLEEVSYLSLGGYDKKDNRTEIVWYDTSDSGDSWNITAKGMWINDDSQNFTDIAPNATVPPNVNFQIGNPYIGLAANSWATYKNLIFDTWNPDLMNKRYCNTWQNNEFCFWANTECDQVNLPGNFTIQLGDYNYTIPMKYFTA